MIEIDGKILSEDLLTTGFACDLTRCKGICCVEGNSGAPLLDQEAAILEREFPAYRPYMTAAGIAAVEAQGFAVRDADGDLTTPLVGDAECAYALTDGGVTLCAIERAWRASGTKFVKPVSCHLYPIRVIEFSDGSLGLNYHRWSVCAAARESTTPVYRSLREPIVRRFGEAFFRQLEVAEALIKASRE